MKIDMQQWASETMANSRSLFFPVMTYPGLPLIEKNIKEMTLSGEVQFQCISALANRYPMMPAIPMSMDLSLEAEAFGAEVIIANNEVPSIKERIIEDYALIEQLPVPRPDTLRLKEFLKAAGLLAYVDFGRPVFSGCIGPYSLAGRLLDITEIMTGIFIYPDEVHLLLQKTTAFLIDYLNEIKATGVNGVIMAEPAAGLLGADQCDEFSSNYVKQIVEAVQTDDFWVVLHNCGNTTTLVESMVSTGAKAFHFGNAVNMADILPQVPGHCLAMGNIDPVGVIKQSSPEQISEKVSKLKELTLAYTNFILSSGCDIPPGTSLENIDALFG